LKKLLILGGSGFIGSSIVDYGINKNLIKNRINKIYILSRSAKFSQNKKKHISITYINKSMLDVNKLPQVDYIIYCLKNSNIKISNSYFNQFLKILKNFKKKPKILFTSSGAVYGKNINKRKDIESKKIDNILIDNFVGYKKKYAKEKVFLEEKFKELAKKNYKVSIARCYTFIGKHIIHYDYAISDLINAANYKSKITLNSHVDVFRSYMHSDDLSNWLITILKNSNTKCPIYNVGSNQVVNLKDLTKKIGIMTNKKTSIKIKKSNKFDYYIPSISKAYKDLNLKISINLNDALKSIIKSSNDEN
jgi:nucleoside-diphosphate-sugar epimerase